MIYKKCVMTIDKNKATLDEDIYLYRLDKNIELYFTIVNNKYRFNKGDMNNIILITNASFFQVRLYKNAEIKYTFAIQPTDGGQAILTITDDLIDDPIEVGDYDFQISLLDEEKTSMISMPIVSKQLHVCEPLVSDDATMGKAILGLSKLASGEIKNAFDSEGNYIREIHKDGDILSASIINKFEEALDTNTKAIKNGTGTTYDDTAIKKDINTIKTDLGTEELTTTAKDVKGAVNEVAAQYKDITNKKMDKNSLIGMSNLSQEVKEAMTGGSVAVVGKGAVLDENIADASYVKAVTNNFLEEGLFNDSQKVIYDNTYNTVSSEYTHRNLGNGMGFGFTYNQDYDKLIISGIKAENAGDLIIGVAPKDILNCWNTETEAKCLYSKHVPITAEEQLNLEVDISDMNDKLTKGTHYMLVFYSILNVESPTYNSNNAIYLKYINGKGALVENTPIEEFIFILNFGSYAWSPVATDIDFNSCVPAISLRRKINTSYKCHIKEFVVENINETNKPILSALINSINNFAPQDIPLIVDDKVQIFYDSIFNTKNVCNYNLKVENALNDFFERKATIVPTAKTKDTITKVTLVDDYNRELSTVELNFKVYPIKSPSTSKNLLIIGDSLTEFGDSGGCETASTLYEKLQEKGITNINFIGTKSGRVAEAKNEGRAGWRVWDYMDVKREGNPFVYDGAINFQSYCNANSYSGIDYCIIHMNWNAWGFGKETMWNTLKELADKLLESYPQCKIFIVGMSAYSKYKYSGNWYCTKEEVWEVDKYYQQKCNECGFRYINLLLYRDMDYANNYKDVNVNLRNTKETEKELADHVHCGNVGYQQIADVYFRELVRQINLDS